ncbi:UNVERIFIED_CONTAM: Retrovirus-related Pol polyprotein from transposon TNT 1-94 [Sesamum calycinum]|uniref:Retrovirus-related Pol polyprotein from transposon TNT 1-94 n=1 Tax=Sesamum calycinum TaxID=2727403 RepID=A0AAW2JZJ9_9LAMI
MILRVEKQREVNLSIAESMQNVAMQTKGFIGTGYRGFPRKRDKQGMICENCGKTGHSRETCFEIHGIPEWKNGRKLYVLEEQSFKEETIKAYQESKNALALNVTVTDIETWHKRLGHSSSIVLRHLPCLKEPLSEPKPVDTDIDSDHTHQLPTTIQSVNTAHTKFVDTLNKLQEPRSYVQAMQHQAWIQAMDAEIQALERNQTWDITPLPNDKKLLAVVGFTRLLLALAASKNWHVHQIDVNNAFLHGNLEEEIYMQPPEGYLVPPGHVCKLKKSLYELKQASRQLNYEFTTKMESLGFIQSKNDYCLFTKLTNAGFVALLVYVDDILIAGPSSALIAEVKQHLDQLFTVKDLGVAKFFLGIEIVRSPQGMASHSAEIYKGYSSGHENY